SACGSSDDCCLHSLPLFVLTLFEHVHGVGNILMVYDGVAMKHRSCLPAPHFHGHLLGYAPAAHVAHGGSAQIVEMEARQTGFIAHFLPASAEITYRLAV